MRELEAIPAEDGGDVKYRYRFEACPACDGPRIQDKELSDPKARERIPPHIAMLLREQTAELETLRARVEELERPALDERSETAAEARAWVARLRGAGRPEVAIYHAGWLCNNAALILERVLDIATGRTKL
jgi:hypothetical protein